MTKNLAALRKTRKRAMLQAMMRICVIVLSFYVGFGLLLYTCQRFFVYPGSFFGDAGARAQDVAELRFKTSDGLEAFGWYAPPSDAAKPLILFFHGNGITISTFYPKAKYYMDMGYGAFICEYRGYSGRAGKPTEQGLYNDADACLNALKEKGHEPKNMVYYGESLGTGVAVNLAAENPPKGVVLESAYSSVRDVAEINYGIYPVDWMLDDKFDSIGKIEKVKAPLLIVHGVVDGVIPFGESRRLFDKANQPKQFAGLKRGDHNDLYEHGAGQVIGGWLDKLVKADKPQ